MLSLSRIYFFTSTLLFSTRAVCCYAAQLFGTSAAEMLEDLEQGDVSETVRVFFERSTQIKPLQKSALSIIDVDRWLDELTQRLPAFLFLFVAMLFVQPDCVLYSTLFSIVLIFVL